MVDPLLYRYISHCLYCLFAQHLPGRKCSLQVVRIIQSVKTGLIPQVLMLNQ